MDFTKQCKDRYDSLKTVLCLGLDPLIEKIPLKNKDNIEKTLIDFYFSLIDNFHKYVLVVKPNIAFYEQYGIDGLKALKEIIKRSQMYEIPVILDAKRGDIGATSKAYAVAAFDDLNADAITLSPYLGEDSLSPFFEYREKGFFVLARTSNKGSSDFQMLELKNNKMLFQEVSEKIVSWNKKYTHNIGSVAGATHLGELEIIAGVYKNAGYLPLLIPGVGAQGADFKSVINVLLKMDYPLHKVFVNSSSKINFAHLDHPGMDYLEASLIEIRKMML